MLTPQPCAGGKFHGGIVRSHLNLIREGVVFVGEQRRAILNICVDLICKVENRFQYHVARLWRLYRGKVAI